MCVYVREFVWSKSKADCFARKVDYGQNIPQMNIKKRARTWLQCEQQRTPVTNNLWGRTIVWLHFNFFFFSMLFFSTQIPYHPNVNTFWRFGFQFHIYIVVRFCMHLINYIHFTADISTDNNVLFYSYLTCHTLIVKVKCWVCFVPSFRLCCVPIFRPSFELGGSVSHTLLLLVLLFFFSFSAARLI